jgi:hypothetical protein
LLLVVTVHGRAQIQPKLSHISILKRRRLLMMWLGKLGIDTSRHIEGLQRGLKRFNSYFVEISLTKAAAGVSDEPHIDAFLMENVAAVENPDVLVMCEVV